MKENFKKTFLEIFREKRSQIPHMKRMGWHLNGSKVSIYEHVGELAFQKGTPAASALNSAPICSHPKGTQWQGEHRMWWVTLCKQKSALRSFHVSDPSPRPQFLLANSFYFMYVCMHVCIYITCVLIIPVVRQLSIASLDHVHIHPLPFPLLSPSWLLASFKSLS